LIKIFKQLKDLHFLWKMNNLCDTQPEKYKTFIKRLYDTGIHSQRSLSILKKNATKNQRDLIASILKKLRKVYPYTEYGDKTLKPKYEAYLASESRIPNAFLKGTLSKKEIEKRQKRRHIQIVRNESIVLENYVYNEESQWGRFILGTYLLSEIRKEYFVLIDFDGKEIYFYKRFFTSLRFSNEREINKFEECKMKLDEFKSVVEASRKILFDQEKKLKRLKNRLENQIL
jgi:hypothetical protein